MKILFTTCLVAFFNASPGLVTRTAAVHASQALMADTTTPMQVVKAFLMAYQAGNHEQTKALLHPQVTWQQPGQNRLAGTKHTRAEVLQMGHAMQQLSASTIKLTSVEYFAATGNQVACILHWQGAQPPGGLLDVANIDVYTVEKGLITQVQVFSADLPQENRFWGLN